MADLTGNAIDREGSINLNIGIAPFHCKLWYKIYGEWPATTTKPPTLILHGGPGFTSDYLLCMRSLASPPYAGTIIFFDQLGSGKSTHLPHTLNDHDFWTEKVFLDQIEAVISQLKISSSYCLFGQSWGAMLAASWASKRRSEGLKRLVLASGPVSSMAWCNAYKRYRNKMPDKEREILEQERSQRTWTEPSYLKAIEHFYRRHFMSLSAVPADLQKSYDAISDDPTVTLSCLGPDEFVYTGFMNDWRLDADEIGNIKVPTLVTNGRDEGCDEESIWTWQKNLSDYAYVNFANSTHMAHFEEPEKFLDVVGGFLYPVGG